MIQITFLGTSSMVPTKDRNVQGIYLKFNREGILFDCGEGTQRQMNIAGISRLDVTRVFITHWHGDHVSGLIGFIQTIGNSENPPVLEIHGPKETKKRMNSLLNSCIFDKSKVELKIFEHDVKKPKVIVDCNDFQIKAAALDHGLPTLGYTFIEKDRRRVNTSYLRRIKIPDGPHLQKLQSGKSISYKGKKIEVDKATTLVEGKKFTVVMDTKNCTQMVPLAKDSDVLVCEATYCDKHIEKAEKYRHMTASQAALLASEANVKKLVLTHFSQRYKSLHDLKEEAETHFDNVVLAHDFMKIKL